MCSVSSRAQDGDGVFMIHLMPQVCRERDFAPGVRIFSSRRRGPSSCSSGWSRVQTRCQKSGMRNPACPAYCREDGDDVVPGWDRSFCPCDRASIWRGVAGRGLPVSIDDFTRRSEDPLRPMNGRVRPVRFRPTRLRHPMARVQTDEKRRGCVLARPRTSHCEHGEHARPCVRVLHPRSLI